MGYLDRINECNRWNNSDYGYLYDHQGRLLGRPKKSFIDILIADYADVFTVLKPDEITINPQYTDCESRSQVIHEVLKDIQAKHQLFPLWRNEKFRASVDFYEPPEFILERGAVAHFGLKAWGVFVNGYVYKPDGLYMWIAKRADNKASWPSQLDQLVGGGQPADLTVFENVVKEAEEEANIPAELAKKAQSASAITYTVDWNGLHRDEMFIFDLELPSDFIPSPNNGEVENFTLMHHSEIADIVQNTRNFKDNSAVVIIDFFIRHNLLTPENPDYLKIITTLRQ